jgi:hypothetical protein
VRKVLHRREKARDTLTVLHRRDILDTKKSESRRMTRKREEKKRENVLENALFDRIMRRQS